MTILWQPSEKYASKRIFYAAVLVMLRKSSLPFKPNAVQAAGSQGKFPKDVTPSKVAASRIAALPILLISTEDHRNFAHDMGQKGKGTQ